MLRTLLSRRPSSSASGPPDASRRGARARSVPAALPEAGAAAGARQRAHRGLLVVCAGFAVLSAVLVPLTLPLGWDELVYASRFDTHGPQTPFSSPRTRGVPLLLVPVAGWSGSTLLLRVWMTLLASLALYLGFRPWLRVVRQRPSAAWVAAALYATPWLSLFYANSAMPNHYTAMGAVGATGCFLRDRPRYAGVVAGLALVTLMRPNDGAVVALPLFLAAVAVPAWRDLGRLTAVAGGVAIGALPWVVEAYLRFGGVRERLADADEVQGGMRPVFSVFAHLTSLDGPLLCRPCVGDTVWAAAVEWWVLLPVLVALGLLATRRTERAAAPDGLPAATAGAGGGTAALWLAVVVAVASALPYFFLVPYAAPRFLLPAYGLASLPAALGLLAAADHARKSRPIALVLGVALLGHLAVQLTLVHGHGRIQVQAREDWRRIAAVLHEQGVRPPCVITANTGAIPLAHTAGCLVPESASKEAPERLPNGLVLRRAEPPGWARGWPVHPVEGTYEAGWTVLVRP